MSKNPFQVIDCTPKLAESLASLPLDQRVRALESLRRLYASLLHPDVTGRPSALLAEVNNAIDSLKSDAKADSTVDIALLEHCLREHLNLVAPRVMAVLHPLKVVIDNYPEGKIEELEAINNPEDPSAGMRMVPFSKVIFIEKDDFQEEPHKKFFRLAPGREVRLKHAYYITCQSVVKNDKGEVIELHCTYDPESRGGGTPDNRRVEGTLHWVSAQHAVDAEVRLFDRLFVNESPDDVKEGAYWKSNLNPHSLDALRGCKVEPSLANVAHGSKYQFLRQGYFSVDLDSKPGKPVFNRAVVLKDTWAKIEKKHA